jgi:hypothetical protein
VEATSGRCREANFEGAVVTHDLKHSSVSDHPVCGVKVGSAEILFMPQSRLLTRREYDAV